MDDMADALGVANTWAFRFRFALTGLVAFVCERLAWCCPHASGRRFFYRCMGVRVGVGGYLGSEILFDKNVPERIRIGDHVLIGDRCIILAHANNNRPDNELKRLYPARVADVVIEDHCVVMPGATILLGVTIGHHSLIGNGVVVASNVPPHSVVFARPPVVMPSMRTEGTPAA
jgi:acetyltransferase-like isoleucine patch superfamily enzyme